MQEIFKLAFNNWNAHSEISKDCDKDVSLLQLLCKFCSTGRHRQESTMSTILTKLSMSLYHNYITQLSCSH